MPAKKPSAKESKARKTVSASSVSKPAAKAKKPAAKPAAKTAAKPAAKAAATKPVAKAVSTAPAKLKSAARASAPKPAHRTPARAEAAAANNRAVAPAKAAAIEAATARPAAGASLLSGPRNVQPYVQRKGEEYMSKEQLEHFRMILSTWKQDLMQEVDRTMLHMKDEAANFPDPNDRATQESEFSLELRTRDRERKLIRKIDEALKRIEDGSYGYCLETGEPIGVKRLEARPVATLSVEAQERRERREKQFGDRDDWYR
jgi:DnaK suppressor protein